MSEEYQGLVRRVREADDHQPALFPELEAPEWQRHWWGMPSFVQRDARPEQSITVHFMCFDDVREFARRLGLTVTSRTDSLWFPPEVIDAPSEWEYGDAA